MSIIIRSATGPCQQMTTTGNGYPWQDGDVLDAADLNAAFLGAYNNVGRNLIHNSMFNVAQRGVGPFTTDGVYTVDRWVISTAASLDTVSFRQVAANDTGRAQIGDEAHLYYFSNVFTGSANAAAANYVDHRIEFVRRLSGKTVTLSFWAVSPAPLKLGVNMFQLFGAGGSPSAAVQVLSTGLAVQLTTAWARYSVTITLPSTAGKTLGTSGTDATWLRLYYSSGATGNAAAGNIGVQSGEIDLWGVQLEIGTVATPLEKPDPRYELDNCMRFYQAMSCVMFGYGLAGAGAGQTLRLYPMRRDPVLAVVGNTSSNATFTPTVVNGGVWFNGTVTATGSWSLSQSVTASADL